jgi:Zn-dependent protease
MPLVFIQYLFSDTQFFLAVVITVVISICLHELSHGLMAIWLGDRTPIETGHMAANPAVHMGLISLVTLLLAGIAWGLMPIDPRRLRGKYGPALVALAGPACNVLLGLVAMVWLGLWQRSTGLGSNQMGTQAGNLQYLLWVFGATNFELAIFNLIPIPPLDGSRILANFSSSYATMMRNFQMAGGMMVLFIFVFALAGKLILPAAVFLAKETLILARGH